VHKFVTGLTLFVLLVAGFGCASSTEYKTYNDTVVVAKKKNSKSKFRKIEEIPKFNNRKWLMAPGFLFSINHPTDDRLRGKYRISFDGILRLPYNVRIKATGLTFKELKQKVLDSYEKYFQKGVPNVTLKLLYKQYYVEVRGFVKNSGRYLVTRKESIDKVIDLAGGLNGNLKTDFFSASIKQQNESYSISLNQYFQNSYFAKTFTWTGGDTIFINILGQETDNNTVPMVSVMGAVTKPGKTLFKDDANLFYYIQQTGGTVANVSYDESYIIRNTDKGLVNIQFDITEMSTIPQVQAGDIIMLNGDSRTLTDKAFQRASEIANILISVAFLILAL
jgi:protein involved in polysaccharide export with SLBB domain